MKILITFLAVLFVTCYANNITFGAAYSQKICNKTGKNAYDVELFFAERVTEVRIGGMYLKGTNPNDNAAGSGLTMSFQVPAGTYIGDGGNVTVRWNSTEKRRYGFDEDPGYWTDQDGGRIAKISIDPILFDFVYDAAAGTVDVYAENAYSVDLSVFDIDISVGVPPEFYNTSPTNGFDSDSAFSSGDIVISGLNGLLSPGITQLVDDYPATIQSGFFAARAEYFNPEYPDISSCYNAFGTTPVPEPVTLALVGVGLSALGLWRRRKS